MHAVKASRIGINRHHFGVLRVLKNVCRLATWRGAAVEDQLPFLWLKVIDRQLCGGILHGNPTAIEAGQ